jgi:hypothetical protein
MRTNALILLALAGPICAIAKDRDFSAMQRQLEAAYGVKEMHIPFMNVARLAINSTAPFAGRAFEIAIYQDIPDHEGWAALKPPGPEWTQVIRTEESRNRTLIFARPEGRRIRILLVTEEPQEIVLVESDADPGEFLRCFHSTE